VVGHLPTSWSPTRKSAGHQREMTLGVTIALPLLVRADEVIK
jgi:hypothetical protein